SVYVCLSHFALIQQMNKQTNKSEALDETDEFVDMRYNNDDEGEHNNRMGDTPERDYRYDVMAHNSNEFESRFDAHPSYSTRFSHGKRRAVLTNIHIHTHTHSNNNKYAYLLLLLLLLLLLSLLQLI
ncbi:hypothetical protein RFI_23586, partial [Reticulomyxa filosa]